MVFFNKNHKASTKMKKTIRCSSICSIPVQNLAPSLRGGFVFWLAAQINTISTGRIFLSRIKSVSRMLDLTNELRDQATIYKRSGVIKRESTQSGVALWAPENHNFPQPHTEFVPNTFLFLFLSPQKKQNSQIIPNYTNLWRTNSFFSRFFVWKSPRRENMNWPAHFATAFAVLCDDSRLKMNPFLEL